MAASDRYQQFKDRVLGREVGAESTADDYIRWIKRFEDWFEGDNPTEATLRDFDSYLVDGPPDDSFPWNITRPLEDDDRDAMYAHRTRRKAISALKHWLRLEYGTRVQTHVQNIVLGEPADFDPEHLSQSDVRDVIEAAGDDCDLDGCKAAMQLGYDAILRAAELTAVEREQVDLDRRSIRVQGVKGSLNATVGLSDRTVRYLGEHMAAYPDRGRLFHNSYGRAWKPKAWVKHFRRKHHEAGFHAFARHSSIVHRLNSGEGFGDVYRRARHSHPQMTARYARVIGVGIPDWVKE
jgi:integrase